jgi:hypothetical protein
VMSLRFARGRLSETETSTASIDDIAARESCSERHVNMTISPAFLAPCPSRCRRPAAKRHRAVLYARPAVTEAGPGATAPLGPQARCAAPRRESLSWTVRLCRLDHSYNSPFTVTVFDVAPINARMTLAHICYKLGPRIVRKFSDSDDPIQVTVIPAFVLAKNNGTAYGKPSVTYTLALVTRAEKRVSRWASWLSPRCLRDERPWTTWVCCQLAGFARTFLVSS